MGVGMQGCVSSTPVLPTCGFLAHRALVSSSETLRVDWAVQVAIRAVPIDGDISRDFLLSLPVDLGGLTYPSQGPLLCTRFPLPPHDRRICRLGRVIHFLLPFLPSVLVYFPRVSRFWNIFLPFFQ